MRSALALAAILMASAPALAENAVKAVKLDKEPATLHCLGYRWYIQGDDNRNATVEVFYREAGGQADRGYSKAMPLRRIEVAAMEDRKPSVGQGLFAGSILFLKVNTQYQVKLVLKDPDGGEATEEFVERTWGEPVAPAPRKVVKIAPGQSVRSAVGSAGPGTLVLLAPGIYKESGRSMSVRSGTPDAPVVIRGPAEGEAIIEGNGGGVMFGIYSKKHVYFENLTIRKAGIGFQVNGSQNLVIRRCKILDVGNGVSGDGVEHRILVSDCEIGGRDPFPRPKGFKSKGEPRGIQLSGTGNVMCYNTVRNFRDGIDVRPPYPVRAIDIHNNEISEMSDDGMELDFSEHNTRAYLNRLTNIPQGITFQPIRGGPAYAVRNVLYNVGHETWKLHLTPTNKGNNWWKGPHRTSGGVMIHNTIVKSSPPFRVWSNEGPANYFYMRNNLYVGTGKNAIECTPPLNFLDSDFNIYANGDGKRFSPFAWIFKKTYRSPQDMAAAMKCEGNSLNLAGYAGMFAASVKVPAKTTKYPLQDLRLGAGSPAIDRGTVLPGINDGFKGRAPDVGAYELGQELPHYGIRPRGKEAEIDARIGAGPKAKASSTSGGAIPRSDPAKPNPKVADDAKARKIFKSAREFERAGMKALALALYEKIVKEHPESAVAEEAKAKVKKLSRN